MEGNPELFKAKAYKFPVKKNKIILSAKLMKKKSELFRAHLIKVFQPYHNVVNNDFEEYVENSQISPLTLYLAPKLFTPDEVLYH